MICIRAALARDACRARPTARSFRRARIQYANPPCGHTTCAWWDAQARPLALCCMPTMAVHGVTAVQKPKAAWSNDLRPYTILLAQPCPPLLHFA